MTETDRTPTQGFTARPGAAGTAVALAVAAALLTPAVAARGAAQGTADASIVADFQKRVAGYIELHRKLDGTLPPLPSDATVEQIDQRQRSLERLIGRARGQAKQGEIFAQEIRAYFRRQLSRVFSSPEGRKLREGILAEFPRKIRPQVNTRYPDGLPVTTVPPQMLLLLPSLPPELEYRFMGEALILLDVPAHLVVDFVDRALPR